MTRAVALLLSLVVAGCLVAVHARAQAAPAPEQDDSALFASGVRALHDGRAGDAVVAFEALADRGAVDPVSSYDRGLAYAERVRIGGESPGDLGRAIHGFEEARELSNDGRLVDDATKALMVARSEVARRRLRAGQPVEVDPSRSLSRALSRLLSENVWAWLCVATSSALTAGLFVRWLSKAPRARVGGGVTAGVSMPLLVVAVGMTLAVRHDRLHLREAVVVTSAARPLDARGIAVPGATALPEGARVEVIATEGGSTRVRFGSTDEWIASGSLRDLARTE
jgi:hypothetical protein